MALFEFLEKNTGKWSWFVGIFIFSILPVILRFFIGMHHSTEIFDIKDLLFAALAMNLSNLSLATGNNIDTKLLIVLVSSLFCILIVYALGVFMDDESTKTKSSDTLLFYCSIVFSLLSIIVSFEANNYTLKNSKSR